MTSQRSERLLRRRTTDRVLGGVAGGLGDYFNIDPLLVRIGFVGLMIFGGAGLVLYVVAWLLIPADGHDASTVEGFIRRLGLTPPRIGWIALVLVIIVLIFNMPIGGPLDGSGIVYIGALPGLNPAALWALGIIVVGIVLLRRRETTSAPAATTSEAPATMPAAAAPLAAPTISVRPRARSPLAWYVCGALLLGIGVLALVSQVADVAVAPGQFFGATLVILGIGLMVGAWWGRARILILLALLLTPLAVAASFITVPLEGGIGDHRYAPVTAAEVRDEYRSLGGRLVLDLTGLQTSPRTINISVSVALGQLVVILPEGASIELHTHVGAGDSLVLGSRDVGTSLDNRYIRHHLLQTTYVLDLQAGIGEVYVHSPGVN